MNNVNYAYSFFINQGMSRNAAAGIVGNLKAESGVDPNADQAGGPGMGIAQWSEGERWDSLVGWAANKGLNPRSLDTQLRYIMFELRSYYPNLLANLRGNISLGSATSLFMTEFERPADQTQAAINGRIELAQDVRGNNSGSADTSGGGGGGGGAGGGGGGRGGRPEEEPLTRLDFGFDPEFLKKHPAIDKLVEQAVDKEWSINRFEAEVKQTEWWQTHTMAQRDWQITVVEDPGEAARMIERAREQVRTMARQMGVRLNGDQIRSLAERSVKNGMDSTELQLIIGQKYRAGGKKPEMGDAAQITMQLEELADEFGLPLDNARRTQWTQDILSGRQTVEGYADVLRRQAKNTYGHLAPILDRGVSVRDWAEPYLQQASSLLGVSTEEMRLDRGRWAALLKPTDDGKIPTMDEWQRTIMNEKRFGYDKTNDAQETAAELAGKLGQMMGAI